MYPLFLYTEDTEGVEKLEKKFDLLAKALGYEFKERITKKGGWLSSDEIEITLDKLTQ